MKGKDLLEQMDIVEPELVKEASESGKKERKHKRNMRRIITIGSMAACFCVIIIGGGFLIKGQKDYENDPMKGQPAKDGPTSSWVKTENQKDERKNEKDDEFYVADENAVEVPSITLPTITEGVELDMIGLVVYQGSIYTQGKWYDDKEAENVLDLVGDYLGYAKGNINEWSTQDEYATEFAGTARGDVYSVKGYSPAFRICIKNSYYDEETKEDVTYVEMFENLNGIRLATGADLFDKRLQLRGNWSSIQYQQHENWDNGWPDYEYFDLEGVSEEEWNAFYEELCASEFVDMTKTDIYDFNQAHLMIHLQDQTTVELRLFEGGYVGYQPLGWYFVKMPGELFDQMFEACSRK